MAIDLVAWRISTGNAQVYPMTKKPADGRPGLSTYSSYPNYDEDWRPNFEFDATLQLDTYVRGRSASRLVWKDVATRVEYEMFISDAIKVLKKGLEPGGIITGKWIFCKKGANYGLKLVE